MQNSQVSLAHEVTYYKMIYLFHIFIVATLLMYVGYYGSKGKVQREFYIILFGFGLLTLLFHGTKYIIISKKRAPFIYDDDLR